jgi:outer membrane receptor protein involved in Fe transport
LDTAEFTASIDKAISENAKLKNAIRRDTNSAAGELKALVHATEDYGKALTKVELIQREVTSGKFMNATADMKSRLLQQAAAYDKVALSAKNAAGATFKMNEQQKINLTYQTTDFFTQIASGQSPFIAALQQGGQLKDTMGGVGNMFRAIGSLFTPFSVGLTSVAVAIGSVSYALYKAIDDLDKFNDAMTLTGGLRADRWTISNGFFAERSANGTVIRDDNFADRANWETSARVGALFAPRDGVALRAAAYTGFRLPTLNELYRPFTVFPVATRANAALAVEQLRGVEAGVDLRPANGVSFGATMFYNRLNDAIANITIGPNLRQRGNVDAVLAKGLELTGEAIFGAVALSGSYAYSDSKVRASGSAAALNGLSPAQSPRHAANATLRWTPNAGAVFSATARYVGAQFEDDLESNILPSALTFDGFAQVPITRQVALTARVENILDKAVVTRKVDSSIDLGTPRIVWIGLKFTMR